MQHRHTSDLTTLTQIDALHKHRLLVYEERPFKRLIRRLLGPESILSSPPKAPLTPPPEQSTEDGTNIGEAKKAKKTRSIEDYRKFKEEMLLDFANFESNIVRIQFLFNSNEKERERYAAEKIRIQATAQEVRDSTADLRSQMEGAQQTLAIRKSWDELSEKITGNRLLKPRDEQQANLEKLNNEIAELERESKDYAETWVERREQFGKIMEEGMQLRKLIRDEKEEVERREGMEGHEDGEDGDTTSARGRSSATGTPKPDAGGATPVHRSGSEPPESGSLAVDGLLHPRARSPLRASSQTAEFGTPKPEELDDVDMIEDGGT